MYVGGNRRWVPLRRTLLNELIFYLFKKAWECYSKSLFLLPPLSSSSLCAVPNIRVKRLNPSLSIIIGREVLEKLKENT